MTALIPFGAVLAILAVCTLASRQPRRPLTALEGHALTQSAPTINYSGNPYRMGAYVYVMESSAPSEHDWQGTYIGMQDGYALIRDEATGVVASVNRDQLYSAQR